MASGQSRLTFLIERFGFNRFVLGLFLFFAGATLIVNVVPLAYKQLTYETNEERLGAVLQRGNLELHDLAQRLVNHETMVLGQSDYLWTFPSRALYYLHKDEPELFAVDNDCYYMGTELQDVSPVVGGWPLARTWNDSWPFFRSQGNSAPRVASRMVMQLWPARSSSVRGMPCRAR